MTLGDYLNELKKRSLLATGTETETGEAQPKKRANRAQDKTPVKDDPVEQMRHKIRAAKLPEITPVVGLTNIVTIKPPNLQTWEDLDVGARPCYNLYKLKSAKEVVDLARGTETETHEGQPKKRANRAQDKTPVKDVPVSREDKIIEQMRCKIWSAKLPKNPPVVGLTTIVSVEPPNLQTWEDLDVGARPCYNLYKLKSAKEVVELGKEVFDSLHGTVTSRAICQLMLLAYNLIDSEGIPVFGDIPTSLISTQMEFNDIKDTALTSVASINQFTNNATGHADYLTRTAAAYSFIAASFLRMYTKPYENFVHVGKDLIRAFRIIYGYPMPFANFMPPTSALKCIKSLFEWNTTLRNTFYNFLYAGEAIESGKEMKWFLYGSDNAYSGMHAYTLFLKCMQVHNVSNLTLLSVLNIPGFATEVKNLIDIFENFYGSEKTVGKEKQMWMYARIFDSRFFGALQTKHCVSFTATLAELYHLAAQTGTTTSDPRKIARLQDMTKFVKIEAIAFAEVAYSHITKGQLGQG